VSDILLDADCGEVTLLGLLDLSAAFDTVDHNILINRLKESFGLNGSVLDWLTSFITNRTQVVILNGEKSNISTVTCGVPQGSVLGPILFLLYAADVLTIAKKHNIDAHSYADDSQLYCRGRASSCTTMVSQIVTCIDDINTWMSANRLKLNTDKTEFIWLGTSKQLSKINCYEVLLDGVSIPMSSEVKLLGVVLDSQLSFAVHIKKLSNNCFYYLRQLRTVRRLLTTAAAKTLIHAFVSSRIDYCNSVLHGVCDSHLRPLQSVMRAAARLVLRKRKFDHISADIRTNLHWLPLRKRIEFKTCTLVYKCLHDTAPFYLTLFCRPVSTVLGRKHLRSAASGNLFVPTWRTSTFGPRSFAIFGPSTWNNTPRVLHDHCLTLHSFPVV
jgi:hypothetical protein